MLKIWDRFQTTEIKENQHNYEKTQFVWSFCPKWASSSPFTRIPGIHKAFSLTEMQVMYFVVPPKSVTTCMSSQSIPGAATCIATRPFSKRSIVSICDARQCFCIRYFLGNTPHTHIYALLCPHVPDSMPLSRMKWNFPRSTCLTLIVVVKISSIVMIPHFIILRRKRLLCEDTTLRWVQ